ncbi:hypothetical protein K9L05_03345, partial [Candidatus Babeliales bacterium]|nr:hypothetical protein [Candidatus Babeliales bacterium]
MKITKSLLLTSLLIFCFLQNKTKANTTPDLQEKVKANAASDLQEKIKELEEIIKKQEDLNSAKVKYLRQEIDELQKSQEMEEKEAKKKDELSSQDYKKLQELQPLVVELLSTPDPTSVKFSSISKKEVQETAKKLGVELEKFIQYLKQDLKQETTLTPTPPLAEEKGPIPTTVKVKEKVSTEKKEDM